MASFEKDLDARVSCPFNLFSKEPQAGSATLSLEEKLLLLEQGSLLKSWRAHAESLSEPISPLDFIKCLWESLKRKGVRQTWKEYRWKLVAVVFAYYLIRDLILYVFLPAILLKLTP